MGRSNYSAGKRQRERDKARKKKAKTERQRRNRDSLEGDIPIATVDEIQGGSMLSVEEVLSSVHGRNPRGERSNTVPSRLFVGGLSWSVSDDELRKRFEAYGEVKDAVIVTDRDTGDPRGFGFVTMADRKDAAKAIGGLDGKEFDGRTLVVRQATARNR